MIKEIFKVFLFGSVMAFGACLMDAPLSTDLLNWVQHTLGLAAIFFSGYIFSRFD